MKLFKITEFFHKFKVGILGYIYSISKINILQQRKFALETERICVEKEKKILEEKIIETTEKTEKILDDISNKLPEINIEEIKFYSDVAMKSNKNFLKLQKSYNNIILENKKLLNQMNISKLHIPETSINDALVITANHVEIAEKFTIYKKEERKIILSLLVQPITTEGIHQNAEVKLAVVEKFIQNILSSGNIINNKVGDHFTIKKFHEIGNQDTILYMLQFKR